MAFLSCVSSSSNRLYGKFMPIPKFKAIPDDGCINRIKQYITLYSIQDFVRKSHIEVFDTRDIFYTTIVSRMFRQENTFGRTNLIFPSLGTTILE